MDGVFLSQMDVRSILSFYSVRLNTVVLVQSLSKEKFLVLSSKNFLNNNIWKRCGKDLALSFVSISLLPN